MNIQPTYVTFEQAKLLKEKEFDVECIEYYLEDGIDYSYSKPENWNLKSDTISRPEQWQVVEWLRINHGIWIYSLPYSTLFRPYAEELINKDRFGKWEGHKYSSPQEAYSAAFDYVLNKLI
jgi:hypothetical protein